MSPPCFFLYLQPRRGGVVERPLDTARAVALAEGLDPERALRGQFHQQIAVEHRLADRGAEAAARYQSDDRAVVQDGLAAEPRHGLLHREGAEPAARSLRLLLFQRGAADEVALGLQVHAKAEAGLVGRVVRDRKSVG